MTTSFNHSPPKDGPLDAECASALENTPFLENRAADKLNHLLQSYVPQFNRYACSAASVAIMVNAIGSLKGNKENFAPVTQQALLDNVDAVHWGERLSQKGYKGRHGVSLADLQIICIEALDAHGISYETIDALYLKETMPDLNGKKRQIRRKLIHMARSGNDFILAYFTQGVLTGEWFGSHVSPVVTFDPEKQTVLMLDVDPEVNGPYWVSFDRFFISLVGSHNTYHRRGGGWVHIRI